MFFFLKAELFRADVRVDEAKNIQEIEDCVHFFSAIRELTTDTIIK